MIQILAMVEEHVMNMMEHLLAIVQMVLQVGLKHLNNFLKG